MTTQQSAWIRPFLWATLALTVPIAGQAQVPIATATLPIHGLTGIVALPNDVDKIYSGLNTVIVTTADGVRHVFDVGNDTKVHGGAASLASLSPGTVVAVHYTVKGIQSSADEIDRIGPDGLKQNEGVVTKVDRARKHITLRFADGTTQTLRLTDHAAVEADGHTHSRVVVYYADDHGERVAHYFKPVEH